MNSVKYSARQAAAFMRILPINCALAVLKRKATTDEWVDEFWHDLARSCAMRASRNIFETADGALPREGVYYARSDT